MRFRSFVNESTMKNFFFDIDDPEDMGKAKTIVVFTSRATENSKTKTIENVLKFGEKNNITIKIAYVEDSYIYINEEKQIFISNVDDEKPTLIHPKNTLIICRASVANTTASLDVITQLEKLRFFCLNSRYCIETCADKFRTSMRLVEQGIPTPKTAIVRTVEGIEHAHQQIGGKFPVVVKTIFGTKGKGVFIVESEKSLKSSLQTLWSEAPHAELILQEFIKNNGSDYRVHVLNDSVIAVMQRISGDKKKEFRTNYSLGGMTKGIPLDKFPDELKDLAIKSSKATKGIWTGVDIMLSEKDNKPYVLEVNSSPGTEGIEEATNIPVTKIVLNYVIQKKNWRLSTVNVGYIESMYVDGIGFCTAKFDTGNGSMNAIHADEYKIKDGKVYWSSKGKELESDLVEIKKIVIGGLKTSYEERPVVKLDVKFNGDVFKNVLFCLTNRLFNSKKVKSDILICRSFMKLAGLSVDPSSTYLVSLKDQKTNDLK